jgi:hypothetical protein
MPGDSASTAIEKLEFTPAQDPGSPRCTYTISARGKPADMPVFAYLRKNYGNFPLLEMESLFGFVEPSTLYGGRQFVRRELSDRDVMQLNNAGIGLRIPFTNHHASLREYEANRPLLEKYHRQGNSVITTNDDLARWIRHDFPLYRLDASVIKNIHSHNKINEAVEIYDSVVLPMSLNTDLEFLNAIQCKDRITLFANAGCAFTCPSRICYPSISKMNKPEGGEFQCSQPLKSREMLGMIDFPLQPLVEIGFTQFKLLRSRPGGMTGF